MQHATYRVLLIALSVAFFVLRIGVGAPDSAAQKLEPLSEQKVLELLRRKVSTSRVSEIVDQRGIDFEVTPEIESEIRDAGGDDDLVAALRRRSQHHAGTAAPRTGGLVIKSTPGETEVYLNDEPRGTTSPKGEIRLPNLPPGNYSLRVSLAGYQTFVRNMTVEAGEPQTVYVTLAPKAAVHPTTDNTIPSQQQTVVTPSQQQTVGTPAAGIPVPGVSVVAVRFFEGPLDPPLEKSQRVYRTSFDRATTRAVHWELDLSFPHPAQRIDFSVDAVWYRPDGTQISRRTVPLYVLPEWASSWHTRGHGYTDPGHWSPGSYRVDFYCQNVRVTSGTFQIN